MRTPHQDIRPIEKTQTQRYNYLDNNVRTIYTLNKQLNIQYIHWDNYITKTLSNGEHIYTYIMQFEKQQNTIFNNEETAQTLSDIEHDIIALSTWSKLFKSLFKHRENI